MSRRNQLLTSCDCPWDPDFCKCIRFGPECQCDICTGSADAQTRYNYGVPPEAIHAFLRFNGAVGSVLRQVLQSAFPDTEVTVDLDLRGSELDLIDGAQAINSPYFSDYSKIRNDVLASYPDE